MYREFLTVTEQHTAPPLAHFTTNPLVSPSHTKVSHTSHTVNNNRAIALNENIFDRSQSIDLLTVFQGEKVSVHSPTIFFFYKCYSRRETPTTVLHYLQYTPLHSRFCI